VEFEVTFLRSLAPPPVVVGSIDRDQRPASGSEEIEKARLAAITPDSLGGAFATPYLQAVTGLWFAGPIFAHVSPHGCSMEIGRRLI